MHGGRNELRSSNKTRNAESVVTNVFGIQLFYGLYN